MYQDTILAQATPVGYSGVSVIRISGCRVNEISLIILKKKILKPRFAYYLSFFNRKGKVLDKGIAIYFLSPNSFTGEDILELHGHGSPVLVNLLIKEILSLEFVRIAEPGEFSRRAFLNKKIDLTQAESIIDLINADSIKVANLALNSLNGDFSKIINSISNDLINIRTNIEAEIDFLNEEISFIKKDKIKLKLEKIIFLIKNLLKEADNSLFFKECKNIAIVGKPNVGKSTLLNILTGNETAIVTDISGTTRDVLKDYIYIDGVPFCVFDTAGLCKTENKIEKIGIDKTWEVIKKSDHIFYVSDVSKNKSFNLEDICPEILPKLKKNVPITIIKNKIDLIFEKSKKINVNGVFFIYISAYKKIGIDLLKNHIKKCFRSKYSFSGKFLAQRRHVQKLIKVKKHLIKAKKCLLFNSEDVFAEELYLAQNYLDEITGKSTNDDLLNNIFSNFCIGK